MTIIFWIVLALIIAGAIIFASSLKTRRDLPELELPDGESLPRTLVQRRAGLTLIAVVSLVIAAAASLVVVGPDEWWQSSAIRLPVTALLLGALIVYMSFMLNVRALEARDDGSFDERDAMILGRSSAGVGGAMMAVVAAWMIGLTETYNETHLIPSYFLTLVFWSCVMTNVIASLAGIVLAYRRV